jgi:ribosomal protein L32
MEQPISPPEDDGCPDCGAPTRNGRICRRCIEDHNADNDD